MEEKDTITLKVFFDCIECDINDFCRFMEENKNKEINKKDLELFLQDLKIKIAETRTDLKI